MAGPKTEIGYDAWMKELSSQKPSRRHIWSDDELRFLKEARSKGYSATQISKVMGLSVAAINGMAQRSALTREKQSTERKT